MKKLISLILTLSIILSLSLTIHADWTEQTETQLVDGVSKITITKHISAGTQRVHVLKIDLSNPRLKIKVLSSTEGVSYLEPVDELASQSERTIAAVNGDFFAWYSLDRSRGSAVGLNVDEGELISSAPVSEELASLVFTTGGAVLSQYFKPDMSVTTAEGRTEEINSLNKFDSLAKLAMYTSAWGETFTCNGGNERVAVVINDTVTEIVSEKINIKIPEEGYLLAGLADHTDFFSAAIAEGSVLKTEIYFSPYFDDIETAVGGGTVLIKNGAQAPVTHMRYGRDARTAAGVSKDGKTLYLLTVDIGSGSIGMTLDELRALMFSLGVYDGINLDGGGSTQMVGRAYGEEAIKYINNPESGYHRPVVNALAVMVTGGKRGVLDGITLKTDKDSLNVGETLNVTFTPYDQLYYPLETDSDISASYYFEGLDGKKSKNTFVPRESGKLTVTVKYGGHSAKKTVTVSDPVKYVDCDMPIYEVSVGETVPVTINTVTLSGKTGTIPLSKVKVTVTDNLASVNGNKIVADKAGFGTITFSYDKFTFSAYLSVGGVMPDDKFSEITSYSDGFEIKNATVLTYPEETDAAYKISSEKVSEGDYSGKLWFDFDNELTVLQSAYAVFKTPPEITKSGAKLSLDVYSPGFTKTVLKAMITDAEGTTKRITLSNLEEGWATVSATLPTDIALPAKLIRLYVVESEAESKERGAVYFDNLTLQAGDSGDYESDPMKANSFTIAVSLTAGITDTETLLAPIAADSVSRSISRAPLSYSFSSLVSASNTSENQSGTIINSGKVTLIQYKNASHLKKALSDSKKIVVITVDDISSVKSELSSILPNYGKKDIFVVGKGNDVYVEISDDVRYVTLPALTPSIVTNQKTFVTMDVGSYMNETFYRINRITLWD